MVGKWKRARVIASSGMLVGAIWGSTMAFFTDTASTGASFTTGTIDIAASNASASLSVTDMVPGDQVTAAITVSNAGSIDLRYAMSSAGLGDPALRSALAVTMKAGVTTCTTADFGGSGQEIASGNLDTVAFGSNASGADTGDRTLASGSSEDICVQVTLPSTTTSAVQGMAASATFTFDAEQLDNT